MKKMDLKAKINNQTNTRKTMKPYLTIFLFLTIAFMPTANAQIPGTQNFWHLASSTSLPKGMAITNADQNVLVISVYDTDYKPAPDPLPSATLAPIEADGIFESEINIQGVIGTLNSGNELTITLNYSATDVVDYPAYTKTIIIPNELIEGGGGPIPLSLTYPAGTTNVGTGTIIATIAAASTLNVKKLDLYGTGFKDPTPGYPLASFRISNDDSGGSGIVGVRITSGIPDRKFGDGLHDFIYLPIVGEDGKTWLNHNLGAHYTDVNHVSFNLEQQATTRKDHLAYGSLFQWGRLSDGHELITWTSGSSGTAVNGPTPDTSNEDTPANAMFITNNISPYDWRIPQKPSLWQEEANINNPCPLGYRIPSEAELEFYYRNSARITNSSSAASSNLALTVAGYRNSFSGNFGSVGSSGYYWTNSIGASTSSRYLYFGISVATFRTEYRAYGFPVRCIKD